SFTFDLQASPFSIDAVERELGRRFGDPTKSVQKIVAFQLPDGREIALDKERPPAQLWIEASQPVPSEFRSRQDAAKEFPHHGLPTRLNHGSTDARPVAMVRVNSMLEMSNLL